ncbi:MAG: NAD-dependent epimerase/dehydratase family protein [Lachnospiraceae bacterium]|nr:NAD-dependent epimerase/dehydratase family protein [Lachnospiraceae bacterium]
MTLYENELYIEDVARVAELPLPWERLQGGCLLISGASGMIGSFLTDVILHKNRQGLDCRVLALGRDPEKLKRRFTPCGESESLIFLPYDINRRLELDERSAEAIRQSSGLYILHLASNTHPVQYATDPIGTITTNITGLQNMLSFAADSQADRVLFASSNEIYGENRGDTELFDESYCGYIDCNSLRAGYPESKRCGEALCQAYIRAMDMDIVIPRLTRSYGPTMLMTDTKAISQFIKDSIAGQDIVLKSEGHQLYSYTYVADAVSGLLTVLLIGEKGQAYNIADPASDITLRDLASLIAKQCGHKVTFKLPDETEKAGFSKATKALLCGDKLKALGWKPGYDIETGIARTIRILRDISEK